jgi:hypothetical protein
MSIIVPANSAVGGGFAVDNSCRFNRAGSDYLSRSFSGSRTGSGTKFTYSTWIKRSELGTDQTFCYNYASSAQFAYLYFRGSQKDIRYFDRVDGGDTCVGTSAPFEFNDNTAWYHFVLEVDTTLVTGADRVKLYVNGVFRTFAFDFTPAQNQALNFGAVATRSIASNNGGGNYFDGYQSETIFIDGQALQADSFGEFDEDSGIWKPIDVSGLTFGSIGFYLEYQSSGALGTDSSGGSNTFTANNIVADNQTQDTPTNNFATGNSLAKNTNVVLSEGNLKITNASGGDSYAGGTFGLDVGKWYWENRKNGTGNTSVGIVLSTADISTSSTVTAKRVFYNANGEVYKEGAGGGSTTTGYTYADGDIIGIALDRENGTIKFYKNGTLVNTTTDSALSSSDNTWIPLWSINSGGEFEANFGNPSFSISSGNTDGDGYGNFEYAVPSGYYALNTKNLAEYG